MLNQILARADEKKRLNFLLIYKNKFRQLFKRFIDVFSQNKTEKDFCIEFLKTIYLPFLSPSQFPDEVDLTHFPVFEWHFKPEQHEFVSRPLHFSPTLWHPNNLHRKVINRFMYKRKTSEKMLYLFSYSANKQSCLLARPPDAQFTITIRSTRQTKKRTFTIFALKVYAKY